MSDGEELPSDRGRGPEGSRPPGEPTHRVLASRLAVIAVVTAASAAFLPFLAAHADPFFPVDDAFISFRYAVNLAHGEGLVFNPGERVEGFSNLSWVLLLAAGEHLGLSPPVTARALALASTLATLLLVALGLGRRTTASWIAVTGATLASVAFLFHPLTLPHVLSGLEHPLVASLLVLLTVALLRRWSWTAAAAGLALALSRPEGAVLGAAGACAALAAAWLRGEPVRRTVALPWLTCWFLPLVTFMLWRWWYFGHLVPNSIRAKAGEALSDSIRAGAALTGQFGLATWPFLALAVAALSLRARRPGGLTAIVTLLPAATLAAVNLLIASGDPYLVWHRYLYPVLPLLTAAPLILVDELALQPARVFAGPARRVMTAAVLTVFVAAAVWVIPEVDRRVPPRRVPSLGEGWSFLWEDDRRPELHLGRAVGGPHLALYQLSQWLRNNARPDEALASAEVGVVGYYTGMRVVDTFGLVNPDVRWLPGRPGWKLHPEALLARAPDVVIARLQLALPFVGIPSDVFLLYNHAFRSAFSLAHVVDGGETMILVFRRNPHDPPHVVLDLASSLRPEYARLEGADCSDRQGGTTPSVVPSVLIEREESSRDVLRALQHAARLGTLPDWLPAGVRKHLSSRRHLIAHPPVEPDCRSTLRFPLSVPPGARLEGAFGMVPASWADPRGDGAVYSIAVEDEAGARIPVYTRAVNPAQRPEDRRWFWFNLDLARWSDRTVTLVLAVNPGPQGDPTGDVGGWGQPQVLVGGVDATP